MGVKAKKSNQKKVLAAASHSRETNDFLPLEGGPGKEITEHVEPITNSSSVLYVGHIPHGFYEDQMKGFFTQFGTIKRLRIARNRKTGKSKHYGFIEFENPDVAKIVADEMNNYLLFEHTLRVALVPQEKVHPKLFKGVSRPFQLFDAVQNARKQHNKVKTAEEHVKMVRGILKRDEKRRKRAREAGIDYEFPEFVGNINPSAGPKKIKFDDEDDDDNAN